MECSFELEPTEQFQADQIQMEQQQLLARYGAAALDMETLRGLIPQCQERLRALVNRTAERNGVSKYTTARIENGFLICRVPDEPVLSQGRPNGQA
jgi:hypothetical protein